jgi:ABC-2 type transport system ATP-binding protein
MLNDPENFVIEAANLCKSFDRKVAVSNVSIKVKKGEIFGFLGPNGGGKTTTIRMLCGLLTPDAGGGRCLGYNILTDADIIKLHTGYMTQKFSLYDELTVYENLDFMAHLYQVKNRKDVVAQAIEELGLQDRAHQLTGTLSGGWKQRLSLSAALLHKPQLLLLDEPTAGVDPRARREFWDQIHDLAARGITALVSTHYMDEAERCHRLGYIFAGKILVQGTKEEIISHAGLTTWVVNGNDLMRIEKVLKTLPGIEQVAAFGNSLHVSGKDADAVQKSMNSKYLENYECMEISPSLEDVFIGLGSNNK